MRFSTTTLLASVGTTVTALNPSCAPGGNFDLSKWSLQEPVAGSDGQPRSISSSQLQGCNGYKDQWFSTGSDGSMVLKVPERSQCVTTPNSQHCRSELHETGATWDPKAAKNRLFAEVQVTKNAGEVCVGQIHIDGSKSTKPVAELYLNSSGQLNLGVNTCLTCSQKRSPVGSVGSGNARFTYEIRYEGGKLSVGHQWRSAKDLLNL
ncbi:hypothetical protein NQ176_g3707 [Zarea fungicola]|uniref:Uncharacterized protein n=1 Tax=Zarea fungicola TaxID=93591 RepID=A0ACC1NI83_9HYPO|nr:hypothetical protein NQ176_g3707 [Lecanicillium fungicola]